MSEYHDKYAPKGAKDRVDHIIGDNRKGKIDASDVKLPEREDMGERVIDKPRRAYKKGGKVEGETAHHHAGRKRRDAGGSTVDQLRPQVPASGLYGSGFTPTHAGMLSNAAGLKKGGEAKKRTKRAEGGRTKGKTNINIIIGGPKEAPPQQPMVPPPPSAMPPRPPLPPGAMGAMQPPGMGGGAPPIGGPGMPPQMPAGMGPK